LYFFYFQRKFEIMAITGCNALIEFEQMGSDADGMSDLRRVRTHVYPEE
jgi:hypothetical protein